MIEHIYVKGKDPLLFEKWIFRNGQRKSLCLYHILSFTGAPYGNYWVLDTDYTSYSLIYSCTDIIFGISHVEFAWILARKKTISDEIKDKLFKEISDFKINTQNFMKTNQTAVYCV